MEFDDLLITTGVDSLIRLVKEKKRVEIGMASKLLKIPQGTIEDWAAVLEEEGIIKIEYRLTDVYLVWVPATVGEVAVERKEFVKKKREVEENLQLLEKTQEVGKEELMKQAEAIDRLYTHFEDSFKKLETLSGQLKKIQGMRTEIAQTSLKSVEDTRNRVKEINDSVSLLESELSKYKELFEGKGVGEKVTALKKLQKRIGVLDKKVEDVLKSAAPLMKEMKGRKKVDVGSLAKDYDKISADHASLRKEVDSLQKIISEFNKHAEVLETAQGLMGDVFRKAATLRGRIEGSYAKLNALKAEIPDMEKNLKDDLELMEHYETAISIAKDVAERIPPKKELMKKVEEIGKEEKLLSEEFKKFGATLSAVSGNTLAVGDLISELSTLKSEVEEVRTQLAQDADEIFSAMEEEAETYSTFQKIKAKSKLSLDNYLSQLEKIRNETRTILERLVNLEAETTKKLESLADEFGSESTRKSIVLLDELMVKKKELERVRTTLGDLNERTKRVEKNIKLLSRQAELITLRGEAPAPAAAAGKKKERAAPPEEEEAERVRLTSAEELEFEKKRKELKDLIKRLWDIE